VLDRRLSSPQPAAAAWSAARFARSPPPLPPSRGVVGVDRTVRAGTNVRRFCTDASDDEDEDGEDDDKEGHTRGSEVVPEESSEVPTGSPTGQGMVSSSDVEGVVGETREGVLEPLKASGGARGSELDLREDGTDGDRW
jgi:hypothetical protein